MSVTGISQAHVTQPTEVQTLSSPKTESGTPKATTANTAVKEPQTGEAQGTPAAGVAENNAGREQGNRQNTGNAEGTGTQVNVFA
jgi:hypothetical protein